MADTILNQLASAFVRFPGIGSRQAKRFVYHLLRESPAEVADLTRLITELKNLTVQCERCHRYFIPQGKQTTICDLCSDTSRDLSTILVIEKDVDLENIRKVDTFEGHYFVLGGTLPILEPNPAGKIRSVELFNRVKDDLKTGKLKEVILALSATTEGDHTADYLRKILEPFTPMGLIVSTLGRGLSSGTELEYSDKDTLKNALKNRG